MYKSKLQELCHQHSWTLPEYVADKEGPDHNPKFKGTVTVNGVQFHTPSDQFRSSKEAQNQAAKIAYEHFTNAPALNGSSVSNSSIQPAKTGIVKTSLHPSVQILNNAMAASHATKEICNIYKSQLHIYAQKKNLVLPTYSSEIEGPPHVRRFKSTVTIDGKSYSSPDFYSTLKEAEQTAAKVALEPHPCSEIQEDDSLYKSPLQELAQGEGLGAPIYETTNSGPDHLPSFLSIVEVKGEKFKGQECKTKKQAEMKAAKVAYKCLMDRRTNKNLKHKPEATNKSYVNVARENQENETKTNITIQKRICEDDKDGKSKGNAFFGFSRYESESAKGNSPSREKQANEDRSRQTASPIKISHYDLESTKVNSFSRENQAKEDSKKKTKSDPEKELDCDTKKVIVCPQNQNSTYPTGSTVLPFSDEKWIAMGAEIDPNY